jgi:hypothetical protein
MGEVIDISELFRAVANRVDQVLSTRAVDPFHVYFQAGHYDAVNKVLISKEGSITQKGTKYPLIWMVTPFEQKRDPKQDYYCELSGLDILILTGSNEDDSIDARTAKYFIPRLWPIRQEFKKQLVDSGLFQLLSPDAIPFDYEKDWYYHSGVNGKANLFNDCIDATQIKGLRLRVNEPVPAQDKIFSN